MRRRYIYREGRQNTNIYRVDTFDGNTMLFDEDSHVSELANIQNIKSVQPIPVGKSFGQVDYNSFFAVFSVIGMTIFATFLATSLISFKTAFTGDSSSAIATSIDNKCDRITDPLEQGKCDLGFTQHKLIARSEIPLDAKRIRINTLPNAVCFRDGNQLLIVKDTLRQI
jgi:hypothetical protein